ncbi:M23 family metallopeptidase [Caulobacter sp. S45]|uniref:M23 family metallopeptidase n=1 Tax=Caulobacter sp. S45 TaxID=1641861 RepID=UPI001C2DA6AD|nr:M23 family metallopeptidase [Caulobacter sp. S45]
MRAASALAAPVAMLVGAVGLMGLWTAVPRNQVLLEAPVAPAGVIATDHEAAAVTRAAASNDRALKHLLIDLGAPVQLSPAPMARLTSTAAQTVAGLRETEANLVSAADLAAQARLRDTRATFHATGLDARPYMADASTSADLSPLELRDARVLAARLDVDAPLARQVQRTARDLMAAQALGDAAAALPLATPVDDPVRSSPFGPRTDPFTHVSAFHPGQDFSGHYGQAIHVTAPGVVSFVGQRSGYGNCVEVDHGHGFKTRYGHLEAFTLGVGQVVKTGDVIGRMGSTGRSTGVHLHYEVWASGRLLDPAPFLKAGTSALRG